MNPKRPRLIRYFLMSGRGGILVNPSTGGSARGKIEMKQTLARKFAKLCVGSSAPADVKTMEWIEVLGLVKQIERDHFETMNNYRTTVAQLSRDTGLMARYEAALAACDHV